MTQREGEIRLRTDVDVAAARREVSIFTERQGFRPLERTKLATAASELARNTVVHGGGGILRIEPLEGRNGQGVRLRFIDHGPGIANVEEAMRDGFSTRGSMGVGLGGARRLVHRLAIDTRVGEGTTVTVEHWLT